MSSPLQAEIDRSKERCVCGHKRIAHLHYNGNTKIADGVPTFCGYPDWNDSGKSIFCPCEKYEKADGLPHQPFELIRLVPDEINTTGEKYNNAERNTNR